MNIKKNQPTIDTSKIKFKSISADLFSSIAEEAAKTIVNNKGFGKKNAYSQVRKFYDEICLWQNKLIQNREKFDEFLPFIRMINAKVAYAEGRELVDENFTKLMRTCLDQIESEETLNHCKTFLEAFLGFYKKYE